MWYLFTLILLVGESLLPTKAFADRCLQYAQEVRVNHFREFGTEYPWHYAIGQLQQESGCRNILSNDGVGSQGLPQITWKVWGKYLEKNDVPGLRTTKDQLRSQALINHDIWSTSPIKKLWVTFQIYNGGPLVLKEISRSKSTEWGSAKKECHRKIITFDSGQKIDACNINYDYSKNIHFYADRYRVTDDSVKYPFW